MESNSLDGLFGVDPVISEEDRLNLLNESTEDTGEEQAPSKTTEAKPKQETTTSTEENIPTADNDLPTNDYEIKAQRAKKDRDEGKGMVEAGWEGWSEQAPGWENPGAYPAAAGAGVIDFGVGLVNKVLPGERFDLPSLPQYQHEGLQAVRDISSIIIPTLYISKFLGGKALAADKAVKWKIGQDKFVQWISQTGLNVGTGIFVDEVAPVQERDHNAAGWLKEAWPNTWGWVPDNVATLDSDSPEVKRQKNRNEGAGIGFFSDLLVPIGRLVKGRRKLKQATSWIPENEKAKNWLKKKESGIKLSNDPIENDLLRSTKNRDDQLTELGKSKLEDGVGMDSPELGVHDMFDYTESGVRSTDEGGIVSAGIDQVKIVKQIDTRYGRLANFVSPKNLREVLTGKLNLNQFIKGLGKELDETKLSYTGSKGQVVKHSDSLREAEKLGAALYETDLEGMKKILRPLSQVDPSSGARKLTNPAYKGVMQAIKKYGDEFINLETTRAQGLAATSTAGQISDMAEGARLMNDTPSLVRSYEQILDRLEFLMNLKGQTTLTRQRSRNIGDILKRLQYDLDPNDVTRSIGEESNRTLRAIENIANESRETIQTLREVQEQRPQMLGPLMLAYEVTDGKVASMTSLNKYVRNSTGTISKAFFDGQSSMPSAWTQGVWSNIYNSVLSAVGTPLKAALSNTVLMIERPIATFAGAITTGDWATIRRAHYMYNIGFGETLQRSFSHMNQVFKRAGNDPGSVSYIMRDDIARKNADQMDLLKAHADAAEVEGNFGPSMVVNQIEAMNDLAEHPVLRFSANAMSAFDGFTRSFIGNIEARGRAYDKIMGTGHTLNAKRVRAMARNVYGEMFDETGMITDRAVEYASREIAMNLDNPLIGALNEFTKTIPALKPFMMFPKTSINMMRFAGSHSPIGLFTDQWSAFQRPFAEMSEEAVDQLLSSRGVSLSGNKMAAYDTIRAELKGRKAIGTLSVMGAGVLFTQDRLRGNGIYDKTRQKTRRELGWKPKTYKGLDGNWYSYENLGPFTDWLALTADVMDNFVDGTLDEPTTELLFNKMGFILSANLTDKSFTAGLEPLGDVLAGNPAAAARWAGSFGSGLLPGSGFRNEFARLLTPQLKEIDQELGQIIANRNPGTKEQLADVYDWMDGSKVGEPLNFMSRVWNTYSPLWKVSEALTPEKQFLIDIEFDGRPSLRTNGHGIQYSPEQRSAITQLIGESKIFRDEVRRIMQTKTGKQFRKEWKAAAEKGAYMDREKYLEIQMDLSRALREAQNYAESMLPDLDIIDQQQFIKDETEWAEREGDVNRILDLQRN